MTYPKVQKTVSKTRGNFNGSFRGTNKSLWKCSYCYFALKKLWETPRLPLNKEPEITGAPSIAYMHSAVASVEKEWVDFPWVWIVPSITARPGWNQGSFRCQSWNLVWAAVCERSKGKIGEMKRVPGNELLQRTEKHWKQGCMKKIEVVLISVWNERDLELGT